MTVTLLKQCGDFIAKRGASAHQDSRYFGSKYPWWAELTREETHLDSLGWSVVDLFVFQKGCPARLLELHAELLMAEAGGFVWENEGPVVSTTERL